VEGEDGDTHQFQGKSPFIVKHVFIVFVAHVTTNILLHPSIQILALLFAIDCRKNA